MSRFLSFVSLALVSISFTIQAVAAGLPVALPATGQTTSYAAKDDGALRKGLAWPAQRFTVAGGAVDDALTGLTWGQSFNPIPTVDAAFDQDGAVTWQQALDFIKALNGMNNGAGYLNHKDWRLPNLCELRSLIDISRTTPALPADHPFADVAAAAYWTSSSYEGDVTQAWYVDMNGGGINVTPKTNANGLYLVPVRGGISTFAGTDSTPPQILSFVLPAAWSGLTVPVTGIGTLDNGNVVSYLLSETPDTPAVDDGRWLDYAPTRYTFADAGDKTLYLFVMDAGKNVSAARSATVAVAAVTGYRGSIRNDLPATGQRQSYAAGDDASLNRGVHPPVPRFVNETLDTVQDSMTGFVWPRNFNLMPAIDIDYDKDGAGNDGAVTWQHALDYVKKLNRMNDGAGYLNRTDWRLPNVAELRSLIDLSRTAPAITFGHPFNGVANNAYWTSSSYEGDRAQAWYVDMNGGGVNVTAKTGSYFLVPVRGGLGSFTGTDVALPRILSFAIPGSWTGLTVPVTEFSFLDNGDIVGFLLSESATPPAADDARWLAYRPTRHTFDGEGAKTLHAFVKDAAGNVSAASSANVAVGAAAGYRASARNDLPGTGQVQSFAAGDDAALGHGVRWPLPRFVNVDLKTAQDSVTGLTWPIDFNAMPAVDAGFDKDGTANDGAVTWQHALDFVVKLNQQSFLGFNDWRLPNLNEMRGLTDISRAAPVLPFGHPFLGVANAAYWTSSSFEGDRSQAWYLDMNGGGVNVTPKGGAQYLVPVRGGPSTFSGTDGSAPRIVSFTLPDTWNDLTVPVLDFTVLDNGEVAGFIISESSSVPAVDDAGWLPYCPTRYTFGSAGDKTLYAFVKDAADNLSPAKNAVVTVAAAGSYRAPSRSDLPDTGQITSFAARDDGELRLGADWPLPRFVNENLKTVQDSVTGFVWPRNFNAMPALDAAFDKDGAANDGAVTWQHALDFVAALNKQGYLGYADWRLPNLNELRSLADVSRSAPALPFGHPFNGVQNAAYWSSSSYEGDRTQAWYVELNGGGSGFTPKTNANAVYLVPVRGGLNTFAGTDATAPRIVGFSIPATWQGLKVPFTELSYLDNVGVVGWRLSEDPAAPAASDGGWLDASLSHFVFTSTGVKTLYAWVKDAAGNVSASSNVTVAVSAIDSSAPTQNVLQRTGQTACYDSVGTLLSTCDGTGQDGMELVGRLPAAARFVKSTAIMTDTLTGLVWVRDGNLPKSLNPQFDTDQAPGEFAGDGAMTWQHCLDFVAWLNQTAYRGKTDWRLPNINDLRTLADYSKGGGLRKTLEDAGITQGLVDGMYWSSTSYAPARQNAWSFSMIDGSVRHEDKSVHNFLLAVRGGGTGTLAYTDTDQTTCSDTLGSMIGCAGTRQDGALQTGQRHPAPRFDTSRHFLVADQLTGLVWSREGNSIYNLDPGFDGDIPAGDGAVTWQHALDYLRKANQTAYLGFSDWRLPNLNELASLVSHEGGVPNLWLNGRAFVYTEAARYWSSTSYDAGNAWYLDLSTGQLGFESKGTPHLVLLTRSGNGASAASVAVYRSGTGNGSVTGDGGKIDCGGDCFESYGALGGTVTLNATAEPGSVFDGWSGACSGNADCTVSLLGDAFVTAGFSRPAAAVVIADSGQRNCYDVTGAVVACGSATALASDAASIAGPQIPFGRFRDNDNGTVTDLQSGLIIPRDLNLLMNRDPSFDADDAVGDGRVTWLHALDYIEKLNREKYLGYADWRLPNVHEMRAFGDYGAQSALYTWNAMGLLYNHQEDWYWTSTSYEFDRRNAWLFAPNSGALTATLKGTSYFVLPVRGGDGIAGAMRTGQTACSDSGGTLVPCAGTGQDGDTLRGEVWPVPRFTLNGENGDTLTDQATGLIWASDANFIMSEYPADDTDGGRDGAVSWQKALQLVGKLNADLYLGFDDWRLPSVTELDTLVDYGSADNIARLRNNGNGFLQMAAAAFWSSTASSYEPAQAWYVDLKAGSIFPQPKSALSYVLPVRGGSGFGAASLTVLRSGAGSGTVTSGAGGGIACGGTCFASYAASGTQVTLTAAADGGSGFLGWSGGGCSGTAPCTLAARGSLLVTAIFGSGTATLPRIELPQTAQVVCYDASGAATACAGSGHDAEKRAGALWPYPRFETNQGGSTVTDKLTGLVFPKSANPIPIVNAGFDGDGEAGDGAVTAQHALDFVALLNTGAYLGHSDWRLPNINELSSLFNRSKADTAAWLVSEGGFSDVQRYYWSSTVDATSPDRNWHADFEYGLIGSIGRSTALYVMPVRGGSGGRIALPATGQGVCRNDAGVPVPCAGTGQDGALRSGVALPEARFSVNGDGSVGDLFTGLVWTKGANAPGPAACAGVGTAMSWDQSHAHLKCLNSNSYLGRKDWRLPNANELSSLLQRGMRDPGLWLMQNGFDSVSGSYWSSTSLPTAPGNAFTVDFGTGVLGFAGKTGGLRVIPVAGGTLGTASSLHVFSTGSGTGSVTSNPAGISCGADCDELFASAGGSVVLTAAADPGSAFLGWLGACSGASPTCTVAMNGEIGVTARFAKLYTLSTVLGGNGIGSVTSVPAGINCGTACSGSFADTTSVTLSASPAAGYFFDRWEGCANASGNTCTAAISSASTVTAYFYNKPLTSISLMLSSETILNNSTIDLAGKLTPFPDSGANLTGRTVTLTVTAPGGAAITEVLQTDAVGGFSRVGLGGFTQKGSYTVSASFAGTDRLSASAAAVKTLLVGASAGYAILVEGKIPSAEGIESHNKTTNRIYHAMRDRGFLDENIWYFNYASKETAALAGIAVDDVPSKGAMQSAVETWAAGKMNGSPAPLYIVMVNHGEIDKFHLNNEILTPVELKSWLDTLEQRLNATALEEKRIVINGSCYSGSFIPTLSKPGRIVIASAAADEESYKGTREEPDGVRSGEFFLDALFEQLRRGLSLRDAFDDAADKTRTFTRRGGSVTSTNRFGDFSLQHPLLEDLGIGSGSNSLANVDGDGAVSAAIYLGVGQNITNAVSAPADITEVPPTQYLPAGAGSAELRLKTGDPARVGFAWAEVRSPSIALNAASGRALQVDINLPKTLFTYQSAGAIHVPLTAPVFAEAGMYEIYYYTVDVQTGEKTPMVRGVVYRDKAGNRAPSAVTLISPVGGESVKTSTIFQWTAASDPDNDALTYTLEIAGDGAFANIVHREEAIAAPQTYVAEGVLADATTYYWRVKTIDRYGASASSVQTGSFVTDNTNGLPGILLGYVRSGSGTPIAGATVTVGARKATTTANGAYLMASSAGSLNVTISAVGYQSKNIALTARAGIVLRSDVNMTAVAQYNVTGSVVGTGGAITCTPATVGAGGAANCAIAPVAGYRLSALTDNGGDVIASVTDGNYALSEVAADHAISASFTALVAAKPGDCDGNGAVTITELQGAIAMYLGASPVLGCVDADGSASVGIAEVQKVINALIAP